MKPIDNNQSHPISVDRSGLLWQLVQGFSEEEIRTLCFELSIDFDDLPTRGRVNKARELILYFERISQLDVLISYCQKHRPHVNWEQVVTETSSQKIPVIIRQFHPINFDIVNQHHVLSTTSAKIFIGYHSGNKTDIELAAALENRLSQKHSIFIDDNFKSEAAELNYILNRLQESDIFISLLSNNSAKSEMTIFQIQYARQIALANKGKPRILPVRIKYNGPFEYPLNAYLNHLPWTTWNNRSDNNRLFQEIEQAIYGKSLHLQSNEEKTFVVTQPDNLDLSPPGAFADPKILERPDGTMDPESNFYIPRPADFICDREISRQGVTIVIKAPRQVGKSSLLVRTALKGKQKGKKVAFLDFQLLEERVLKDPKLLFKGFCHWLADELDLEDLVEDYWNDFLSNTQLCTKYVSQHILKKINQPVIIAMDEVDRMLASPFRSDFFGMLRGWHNKRQRMNEWQNLDLLLVISTEPYMLIENLEQSPFNVGEIIRLEDFNANQILDLNSRHGKPFSTEQLHQLKILTGGHPYLIRQALFRVAVGEYDPDMFLSKASQEDGPFKDHLKRHLVRFYDRPELVNALLEITQTRSCSDELAFYRLNSAGLVKRSGNDMELRCKLYLDYFPERLKNMYGRAS